MIDYRFILHLISHLAFRFGFAMKFAVILVAVVAAILFQYIPVLLYSDQQSLPFSKDDIADLSRNLNVVVTGANVGLGLATVEHLVRAGTANLVIMACRDAQKCNSARDKLLLAYNNNNNNKKTKLVAVPLDLSQRDSIQNCARIIQKVLGDDGNGLSMTAAPLHVLVNNAGVAMAWKSRRFLNDVEAHISVNHVGHALLTHYLWPNLLIGNARIVHVSSFFALLPLNVNSGWYKRDYHDDGKQRWWKSLRDTRDAMAYYSRSKKANLCFASELHQRFYPKISSVASHPGYTRTNIMFSGWKFAPDFVKQFVHYNRLLSMSPEDGSLTQLRAGLDREGVPSGAWVGPTYMLVGKPVVVGNLNDTISLHHWPYSRDESSKLWDKTLAALNISDFGAPSHDE